MATATKTRYEAKLEQEVKGKRIYIVNAPLDNSLKALRAVGAKKPIAPRDLAYSRIESGKESSLTRNGSFTSAGFLYLAKEMPLLALDSPLNSYALARKAVEENRNSRYFSTEDLALYEKHFKQAEKDKNKAPEERRVLILPSRETFDISLDQNSDILKGVFGDLAEDYLNFTGRDSLRTYLVDSETVDKQKGTLATQLWLGGLSGGGRSVLGGGRGLYYDLSVRGVQSKPAKQVRAQKSKPIYTTKQVDSAIKRVQRVRAGNFPNSSLDKVVDFLLQIRKH